MSRKRRHEEADASTDEDVFVYYKHTELSSIPRDITSLRIDKSVESIPPNAFMGQESLENVTYEDGLERIGERAFEGCVCIRFQQFPSTLCEIGKRAFYRCERLEVIAPLPDSLHFIDEEAFRNCINLKEVEFGNPSWGLLLQAGVFEDCKSLTRCRLPSKLGIVPTRLFNNCRSLVDVNLPSEASHIGESAFSNCEKLDVTEWPEELWTIRAFAFHRTAIRHLHCPISMRAIYRTAFSFCEQLESVVLPPTLKVIPHGIFAACRKLEEIKIPQSVVVIEKTAFNGCHNLKNVIFSRASGLQRIEEMAFHRCFSLTHLWVPPTVEYIGKGVFADCKSLLSVEVPETLERLVFVSRQFGRSDCGYKSLVNIFLPPSQELDHMHDFNFMKTMKLREAESDYPTLVEKLKLRFDNLPLHSACYFQSYSSPRENIRKFKRILRTDDTNACERADFLRMTPFHILALSQRPQLNLIQELLSRSSVDILNCQDVFGSTPLEYLSRNNYSPEAVSMTKSLLVNIMEHRISFLGLDSWRDDLSSELNTIVQMADATGLRASIRGIRRKLAVLERKEVLSLVETSIWRMKIKKENAAADAAYRESCRIDCGSGIVMQNVLPLLGSDRAILSDDDSDGGAGADSSDDFGDETDDDDSDPDPHPDSDDEVDDDDDDDDENGSDSGDEIDAGDN